MHNYVAYYRSSPYPLICFALNMGLGTKQQKAVKEFVRDWLGKGYEKGETQRFWLDLLHRVFGVDNPTQIMSFELPVKTITKEKGSDFIDAYISTTKVLIEQKGSKVKLSEKARQSDGAELTPYQQGRRYAAGLPISMYPRWIVVCNFTTFEVHDMEHPNDAPEVIFLKDLEKEFHRLSFLVDDTNVHLKKELEVSIQAGQIVGVLYEKFLAQYIHPENPDSQKSLNKLCVRLVFCLYAEDAGIFGAKNMFHDYMAQFPANEFRKALIELFQVLDTSPEDRDPYMDEKLAAFPFVSGGMFAGDIEIPRITEEIRTLILQRASDDFDWSLISPTIFGAVFESTLNPDTRRAGGMHYTSLENIHKVIDPLFLDDLKAELADIKAEKVIRTKKERAMAYQDKLASLKFLDPACGSGNFLTESYTCLRRLENETIKILYQDRVIGGLADPIKVSIYQFYGIEINDFACSVSQAALWIAETQMLQETDAIVGYDLEPLPLKDYHNIHEGNALSMDWNEVVPASEVNYIMGNPPFISQGGASDKGQRKGVSKSEGQKEDQLRVFKGITDAGNLDYVACWHWLSHEYMKGNPTIEAAFVSTNSICQGQQVKPLWKSLFDRGITINYAHQSFLWRNESNDNATVYCVIIGFSFSEREKKCLYLYDNYKKVKECRVVSHINGYLFEAEDYFVEKRSAPFADVPEMSKGFQPTDNGYLLLSAKEKSDMVAKDPNAEMWIRPFSMGEDFIKGTERYCLWLQGITPAQLDEHPEIRNRVVACRKWRSEQSSTGDAYKLKDIPHLLRPCGKFVDGTFIGIPVVTSGARKYVPFGFLTNGTIPGNKLYFIPTDSLYIFGVMTSIVQNAWMRVVAGRFGPSYNYANTLVYNTFPWPSITDLQRKKIELSAQGILDVRALFSDCSLAQLYDDDKMPIELRKAHRANDAAVLEAYGFPKDASESEIVARLFKMYQELTK